MDVFTHRHSQYDAVSAAYHDTCTIPGCICHRASEASDHSTEPWLVTIRRAIPDPLHAILLTA